jgi:signal transduction histidine kinase
MRIFSNLIANAIMHADCSNITLAISHRDNTSVLQVRDDGSGIDDDTLANITMAYKKGPASDGEGLGLAICSQLAESLGMTLHITSDKGKGTVCSIEIPAAHLRQIDTCSKTNS